MEVSIKSTRLRGLPRSLKYYACRALGTASLAIYKGGQKRRFDSLGSRCVEQYLSVREKDHGRFLTKTWGDYNAQIESVIFPKPRFSFLRHPRIASTMCLNGADSTVARQLDFARKRVSRERLAHLIQEDFVGLPIIRRYDFLTSHTSIHHIYHLLRFQRASSCRWEDCQNIVEWGGGYGDMAKIWRRLRPQGTYTIVDTPLASSLQYIYLASVLGQERVNWIAEPEIALAEGCVNLMPVCFVEGYDLSCDLFVATWSLSESTVFAQDFVASRDFFRAKHLLLGFQENNKGFQDAARVGHIAKERGAKIEDLEIVSKNYYAFR